MGAEPKLICVTGPDGAGKTTQIGRIAKGLEKQGKQKVIPVTVWDLLIDPASKGRVPFRSPREVDLYLQILGSTPRALFLYHCFYQALEMARGRNPSALLVNAYWYKYFATEVAHGGDTSLLLRLAEIFPEPAITFYLRVTPEEAFRRKASLSGYETGFSSNKSEEAFVAFQRRSTAVLDELARERGWIELNGNESPESLTELIVKRIDSEV
ncbi:MAG: hypothetical protein HY698_00170 [Deltaproteobacteria bacterium]|nr:hypothetical protein [Deltaproteobacteria bacterium]